MRTHWPVLLRGHTMEAERTLHPTRLAVEQDAESIWTASMELLDEEISIGAWVKVWTPQGYAGVFYASSVSTDVLTCARTVELSHCIGLLMDGLMFGSVTAETMSGVKGATKVAASQVMRYALGRQPERLWQAGTVETDTEQGWSFDGQSIYTVLTTLTESMSGWAWRYDMETLPWTVSIVRRNPEPTCEMRMSRNISTMQMEIDRSGMATRVYPIGASGLTIGATPYIEKNVGVWGLVEKIETDGSIDNAELLRQWGQTRLEQLCQPIVTATISGLELSAATGEPMDRLVINTVCRVPLPRYRTTVNERILTLSWQDVINAPETVSVTMATTRETLTRVVSRIQRSSGGGAAKRKEDKRIWTELNQTDEMLQLAAYNIQELQTNTAKLEITAGSIESTVTEYGYDSAGDLLRAQWSRITQTAGEISQKVSKGEIISAINQTAEQITISASRINLNGYVPRAEVENIINGTTVASHIKTGSLTIDSTYINTVYWRTVKINGTNYDFLCSTRGNTITIS